MTGPLRCLRFLATGFLLALAAGCHLDGLGTHSCDPYYSYDWDDYELELVHNEPRICPIQLAHPGDPVFSSSTITDGGERDFQMSRLTMRNTNLYVFNDQYDFFDVDLSGNWSANVTASWSAGTGSYPCYDEAFYRMAQWYGPSRGFMPSADGQFTFIYTQDPGCGEI